MVAAATNPTAAVPDFGIRASLSISFCTGGAVATT